MYSIIKNAQWTNQCADLLDGKGPVAGYHFNCDSKNQTWTFIVVDPKQREFYFLNAAAPAYAKVDSEKEGASVIGGNEFKWKLCPVSSPVPAYKIMTPDEKYMWRLKGPNDRDLIVLEKASSNPGKDALWTYEKSPCPFA